MKRYEVQQGESPRMIARQHGVSMRSLLLANPHKETTVVNGERTFREIFRREPLNVPVGVGDSVSDAINAIIAAGGPCLQANVMLVCMAQGLLGVTVDGKWGSGTSAAARLHVANAPAACSPRPTWWAPVGQSSCPIVATPAISPPTSSPTVAPVLAPAAVLALGTINPCDKANVLIVCAAQKALGVTVDGKYGTATASAAAKVFPGAPPACSPRPLWWAPVGQSNCTTTGATATTAAAQPAPVQTTASGATTVAVPSAVAALATINPCLQANVLIVYAAQKALGVAQDGKYGTATAAAAQRIFPSAPAACSPRPLWWAPVGQNNPVPSAAVPAPAPATVTVPTVTVPSSTPTTASSAPTAPNTPTSPTSSQVVVAPTSEPKKKLSTGAIVAGAVGVAAVVGLVALAASGKKGARGARGKRGARGHSKHKRKAHRRRR